MEKMKKYQIIYADPPWDVSLFSRIVRPNQLPHPYAKMKLKDIMALPVKNLADPEGCHIFLWTTHKWMPKAFDVIKAWGFHHHCVLTWDKEYGFTPYSFMWSTEFCIHGYIKGKWMKFAKMGEKALVREKSKKHSRKPQAMRDLIIKSCGDLPRIELFAREKTEGWDVWGDEVESDIVLNTQERRNAKMDGEDKQEGQVPGAEAAGGTAPAEDQGQPQPEETQAEKTEGQADKEQEAPATGESEASETPPAA